MLHSKCSWYASCFSSVNQNEKAVSASFLVHLTLLKPLSAHPGCGPKPTPNRPYALTSFFHSVVTCSFCKKLYLFSVPTFIVCVREKQQQRQISLWPLLHRDLRRTRACPLIAESVKSIVRVLCCNASSTLATSLLPLTTLPGETIEELSSDQQ